MVMPLKNQQKNSLSVNDSKKHKNCNRSYGEMAGYKCTYL